MIGRFPGDRSPRELLSPRHARGICCHHLLSRLRFPSDFSTVAPTPSGSFHCFGSNIDAWAVIMRRRTAKERRVTGRIVSCFCFLCDLCAGSGCLRKGGGEIFQVGEREGRCIRCLKL